MRGMRGEYWRVQIGTLAVTKSGRVRMRIGCAAFDVMPGVDAAHRSELALVNLRTKDIVLAGADCGTAVAQLDLQALLLPDA
jgi:hypothetical protein